MQRILVGLGHRIYDTTFNLHSNPVDYVNIFMQILEFFAEYSYYTQLDADPRKINNMFRNFIDTRTGEYSEHVRQSCYERKEYHRLRNGVGLVDMYHEVKGFIKQITAMPTFRAPDPLSTYKDTTNRYKIK